MVSEKRSRGVDDSKSASLCDKSYDCMMDGGPLMRDEEVILHSSNQHKNLYFYAYMGKSYT